MYDNCKIIEPNYQHEYTIILLHPMYSSSNYFNDYINYLKDNYNHIFNNTKFIFPESPIIDIDFPNNKLYQVNSWYNYYTCYDNLNKIDKININDYRYQTMRILNIIINEYIILNSNNKNIYIGGISQGGTLLFNILKYLPFNIGGIISIKSVYMYTYTRLKKNNIKTPIYIFIAEHDEIYNITLQNNYIKRLKNIGYKIYIKIIPYITHNMVSYHEHDFITKILLKKNKIYKNLYI